MGTWILRLRDYDERLLAALVTRRHPRLDRAMRTVTHLGGAVATVSIALFFASGLVPAMHAAGMDAAQALILSFLAGQLLKRTISRRRPKLPVGFSFLTQPPDRFSFPSGHSTASLAVALPLALALPPVAGLGVIVLALIVGLSRCYLGVHYPGDVVVGWLLAIVSVFAIL
jgi:undecaprenyl-diphosphatase